MRSLLLASLLLLGCGGGSTSVALRFANQSPAGAGKLHQGLGARAPTAFAEKLVAVYLAEDVDPVSQNNVGRTEMIYLNPTCQEEVSLCELGPGTNPHDGMAYTHFVSDYFDFAADSATVNAAINAQQRPVAPGTYRYARMEFCKGNEGNVPNLRWAADQESPTELVLRNCGVTSRVFDPPLELAAGDAVAVTLSYDLSGSVSDLGPQGQQTGMFCTATACFTPPAFVPSAAKLAQ